MANLSEERKKEIEIIATNILKEYGLKPGFDLAKFLTSKMNFEIQLQNIDDNTTGLLFVDDEDILPNSNTNNLIVINNKLENDNAFVKKRRFICAHEYGHYVLHKGSARQFARRDTGENKTIEELEAEYFAYCFLLPKALLKHLFENEITKKALITIMEDIDCSKADVIAMLFNVTTNKAEWRLKELELN